jgi:hypothetical protein
MSYPEYPLIRSYGGSIVDLARYSEANTYWSAFNPSIGHNGKSVYAVTLRSSNHIINPSNGTYDITVGNTFQNKLYFSELDKNLKLKNLRRIDMDGLETQFQRGLEDAKLFWRDGSWHFTAVMLEKAHTKVARMVVCDLDTKQNKVTSLSVLPSYDADKPEKNWMIPYEPQDSFDFIYGPNMTVVGQLIRGWATDEKRIASLRGGSNLLALGDETFLAVCHKTFYYVNNQYDSRTFGNRSTTKRNYVHYFVRYDKEGFIISMSEGFQFHKPGVEFAAGLVARGKDFLISFGREDVSSHIAIVPSDRVLQSLTPIEY